MPDVTTDLPKISNADELQDHLLHFVETHADWRDESPDGKALWRFGLDGSTYLDLDISGWGDEGFPLSGTVNASVPTHRKEEFARWFGASQDLEVSWQLTGFSARKHYTGKCWVTRRTAQIEVNP
jgi:hypothetical protein